ncbi:HisA/HisF family protein [uncultured Methanobrevibacter sp.]|uniref:HisA/HisF family protein n=1 Tax=uncultured Methanobrevibacter sp. TaxID=253161 RepID=UPI0025EC7FDE|nr:HisA/HisF family protein [uncultured Methanobrevibacter sp.]
MIKKIPVLDLKDGQAVSGKSGLRDTYQPLQTVFAPSSNPVEIAQGLKLNGADEIYIADLDLIESNGHNINDIKLVNTIVPVILDAGVKNAESFSFFLDYAFKIIVPTETLESLDDLYEIFDKYPKERTVISVDVKNNELFSKNLDLTLHEFKDVLVDIGATQIILLDITGVGTNQGYNKELLKEFEDMKDNLIIAGGLNKDSIDELQELGIKKVLVGTSLHSGEISII